MNWQGRRKKSGDRRMVKCKANNIEISKWTLKARQAQRANPTHHKAHWTRWPSCLKTNVSSFKLSISFIKMHSNSFNNSNQPFRNPYFYYREHSNNCRELWIYRSVIWGLASWMRIVKRQWLSIERSMSCWSIVMCMEWWEGLMLITRVRRWWAKGSRRRSKYRLCNSLRKMNEIVNHQNPSANCPFSQPRRNWKNYLPNLPWSKDWDNSGRPTCRRATLRRSSSNIRLTRSPKAHHRLNPHYKRTSNTSTTPLSLTGPTNWSNRQRCRSSKIVKLK